MTIEEFDNTGFTGGMKAIYKGEEYEVAAVEFEEKLICIVEFTDCEDERDGWQWKRCENIERIF